MLQSLYMKHFSLHLFEQFLPYNPWGHSKQSPKNESNNKIKSDNFFWYFIFNTLNANPFENYSVKVEVIVQFLLDCTFMWMTTTVIFFFVPPFWGVCFISMPVKYPFDNDSRKCQPHNHYDKFRWHGYTVLHSHKAHRSLNIRNHTCFSDKL